MKRVTSLLLAFVLLLSCHAISVPEADAATKETQTRAIAIVYDNSGSMYIGNNSKAWCRATYAMEVFGSMLNKGDVLLIYPMHPIEVDGKEYTMDNPFRITDATKAASIRENFTKDPKGTPIETLDAAAEGLKQVKADKKYMIVLTDGDVFYINGKSMSEDKSKKELDARIQKYAGPDMTVMYLGIGKEALLPNTKQSDTFSKNKAEDSADVLSCLTEMCNQVFGRDTLPKKRISGNTVEFDISMNKLIVFVQGENVANLKVTDSNGPVGKLESAISTKYGSAGGGGTNGKHFAVDTSLQGMMVTYTDCDAGEYTISYDGAEKGATIEIYYEPNADLDFVFTDANGNEVDYNNLYEGKYKVSFGMKDGKTGKLISSDLLGKPEYKGTYYINDEAKKFSQTGFSGEVTVDLKVGDTFKADLEVEYLSGYRIQKSSKDFGWPEMGIEIIPRPAGMLQMQISGGQEEYSLQELEEGAPFTVKLFYDGQQLTGDALESAKLTWDEDDSNAKLELEFAEDHYKLWLRYQDPAEPQETESGDCDVTIHASYTAEASTEATTEEDLSYEIEDDFSPLKIELIAKEDYIVISELAQGKEITVKLTMNGAKLTAEEFAAVKLDVDCGGIEYTLTPNPEKSTYTILLKETPGIAEGDYDIEVSGEYTDKIGRTTETSQSVPITLSAIPLWLKILLVILAILLLLLIIFLICRIRVLPKRCHADDNASKLRINGEPMSKAGFEAEVAGKSLDVAVKNNNSTIGTVTMAVEPGKDSYLCKKADQLSMVVKPEDISMGANVTKACIAGAWFEMKDGKVVPVKKNQGEIILRHGDQIKVTGPTIAGGRRKTYDAQIKLDFTKE